MVRPTDMPRTFLAIRIRAVSPKLLVKPNRGKLLSFGANCRHLEGAAMTIAPDIRRQVASGAAGGLNAQGD